MEGGHSINCSLGTLRMMFALGVRYLTLTHNENVPWADSATDVRSVGGLTRLGDNGGVCMVTFVPMFVSQPVADWYAECLSLVEERGGDPRRFEDVNRVIEERTKTDPPPPCTVADVADHVEYVREVAGLGAVGVGGDYDGALFFPQGMADVSSYPLLLNTLRERGWSTQELELLGHGNVLRAMRDMEQVAGERRRLEIETPALSGPRSGAG
jgi:microsomal dipeptidase-like Zn-dependent dipeptidase